MKKNHTTEYVAFNQPLNNSDPGFIVDEPDEEDIVRYFEARRKKIFAYSSVAVAVVLVLAILFGINLIKKSREISPDVGKIETSHKKDSTDKTSKQSKSVRLYSDTSPWFWMTGSGKLCFNHKLFEGEELVIPSTFDGVAVNTIDGDSFSVKDKKIKKLVISEGIKQINSGAFKSFTKLKKVTIPSTLTRFEEGAFSGTPWYESLDDEFVVIGKGILIKYNGNDEEVNIPETVKYLDGGCFMESDDISSIIIPDGVSYIGKRVFKDCTAEDITVPSSVTFVANDAFEGSTFVEESDEDFLTVGQHCMISYTVVNNEIHIPDDVRQVSGIDLGEDGKDITIYFGAGVRKIADITAIGKCRGFVVSSANPSLDANNDVLISRSGATLYRYPEFKDSTNYILPNTITTIGNNAFENTALERVEIGQRVTSVGEEAFANCDNLNSVDFPDSVVLLGGFCFKDCKNLTSVRLPENLKNIECGMFKDCTSLNTVRIPENLQKIYGGVFMGCDSLSSIYITKNILSIGADAFDGCENLILTADPAAYYEIKDNKAVKKDAIENDNSVDYYNDGSNQ